MGFILQIAIALASAALVNADIEADSMKLASRVFGKENDLMSNGNPPYGSLLTSQGLEDMLKLANTILPSIRGQKIKNLSFDEYSLETRLRTSLRDAGSHTRRKFESPSHHINDFIEEMKRRTAHFTQTMTSMIDYEFYSNLTEVDLHEFRAYCQNVSFLPTHSKLISNTSPLKLLEQLNISLIGRCSLRMTKQHIVKYSECMRLLSQIDIPLKTKASIAYISAMQTQQFHYEVTQKILANDDLLKDYSMEKALLAMDANQGYELSCMPDSIYFSNSCNRKNLVGFLNNIKIFLLHIASGATICSSIISENDAVRREYLEKIVNNINHIVKFQNEYLDNAMDLSFTACEAFVINQTIHDFDSHVDKGVSIRRNRFKTLGDTIINDLASRGSSKMGRHVVITRNLPLLSKYLPSCPSGNCRVIQNTQRDVAVFYTAHDPLKQSMKRLNDDFLNRSMASINNTIWKLSTSRNLEVIRNALIQKNLSLSGTNRFRAELWVRDWANVGGCPLTTIHSTNENTTDHVILKYYYRNKFSFYACENYQIYVFS